MIVLSILVWDTPEYAEKLLQNLLDECPVGQASHKICVLDQGSTWETRRILKRFQGRIELLRVKENIGFPAGHNLIYNTAKESCQLDAFCVVNSDVRFLEHNWLDRLSETLSSNPENAVAGPVGININTSDVRYGHGEVANEEDLASGNFDVLSACVSLVRTSVAEELGLYDEIFSPGYFEDGDMCYRYREAGYRLVGCPISMEHGYLGPRTSTAKQKKDILRHAHGNFRETNRTLFVERWGHRFPASGSVTA